MSEKEKEASNKYEAGKIIRMQIEGNLVFATTCERKNILINKQITENENGKSKKEHTKKRDSIKESQ